MTHRHTSRSNIPPPRRNAWKHWMPVVLLGFGILVGVLLLLHSSGQVTPFSATTIRGEHVSLDNYRGQIVMLNFWATWCPPCRAEMPIIEHAYEQFHDKGFTVLAVNDAERLDQVSAFASQFGLTFPVLLDYSSEIQHQFGITGYPTSLFLDTAGKVYAIQPGPVTADQLTIYIETGFERSAS